MRYNHEIQITDSTPKKPENVLSQLWHALPQQFSTASPWRNPDVTCFSPLQAWKSRDVEDINPLNGKVKMVFRAYLGYPNTKTELPCGQCIGCRLDRARTWATRCMHEASLYKENCFITLTYSNVDDNPSLDKRDMQLFLKRLRKRYSEKSIRYFQCGEYGEDLGRKHHHIILFNYYPEDAVFFTRRNGNNLYLSKIISELWPHGLHSIGAVTFESACYVAKYCLKKITGDRSAEHYGDRLPEYVTMSRNRGIGHDFYQQFPGDIYNHDKCIISDTNITRPPKYYDTLHEKQNPHQLSALKTKRKLFASSNPDNCEERRETKNQLAKLKEARLAKRSFETGATTPCLPLVGGEADRPTGANQPPLPDK